MSLFWYNHIITSLILWELCDHGQRNGRKLTIIFWYLIIFHLFSITFDGNFFYIINSNLMLFSHNNAIILLMPIYKNYMILARELAKSLHDFFWYLIIFYLFSITSDASFFYIINSNWLLSCHNNIIISLILI